MRPWIPRLLDRHITGLPPADQAVLAEPAMHQMRVRSLQEAFHQGEEGIFSDAVLMVRDWGFDLAALTQPVRLWHGLDDTIVHPGFSRWMAERLPNRQASFVPGAGHYLLYTHWTEILRAAVDDLAHASLLRPRLTPHETAYHDRSADTDRENDLDHHDRRQPSGDPGRLTDEEAEQDMPEHPDRRAGRVPRHVPAPRHAQRTAQTGTPSRSTLKKRQTRAADHP